MRYLSVLIMALIMFSGCDSKDVKTNYYDLPREKQEILKNILQTDDLLILKEKSIDILMKYGKKQVLGKNPMNNIVTTNYFWHIYNKLPKFVKENERHHGYYRYEKGVDERESLLAYSIYRISRDKNSIKRLFALAKPHLKDILSPADFSHYKLDNIVRNLIYSYSFIVAKKNYKEKLTSFWNRYYTPTGGMKLDNEEVQKVYNGAYGFSLYDLSAKLSFELELDRFGQYIGSNHLNASNLCPILNPLHFLSNMTFLLNYDL